MPLRAWPDAPGHSNQVLRYWRQVDRNAYPRIPREAHRALPDAIVTAFLLRDLLEDQPLERLARLGH